MPHAQIARPAVGGLLRDWRNRRRLTQLDLALEVGISTRHLSFVETGRSRPSPDLIIRLSEELDVPLRERNRLLLAAGYAPAYAERGLEEPEMGAARDALDRLLAGHHPNPAVIVDRHWGLVAANEALGLLTDGVAPALLEPPVNVLRLSLHPDGMAPRILNLVQWRSHLLDRLGREAVLSGDPALSALHEELSTYPAKNDSSADDAHSTGIAVPLRLRVGTESLSFISTVTTFGTAIDVTLSELSIESFFPADAETASRLRTLGDAAA